MIRWNVAEVAFKLEASATTPAAGDIFAAYNVTYKPSVTITDKTPVYSTNFQKPDSSARSLESRPSGPELQERGRHGDLRPRKHSTVRGGAAPCRGPSRRS